MYHFGVLSHKGRGHLNPLIALSRQLTSRGHRVTFVQKAELEPYVLQGGLEFSPLDTSAHSCSDNAENIEGVTSRNRCKPQTASDGLHSKIERIISDMETFLRETPAALGRAGVDALIIDEIALAGPTVAQMLGLPYFVISTSVPHNFGWYASRKLLGYRYPPSKLAQFHNGLLQVSVFRMRGPVRRGLDEFRRKRGLGPIEEIEHAFPPLAHIAQLPQCLDLPRTHLPENFHYTGPFVDEATRPIIEFPWQRLDGRRLVYASLGTARSIQRAAFHLIAAVCAGLNVQLVISLGGRGSPEMFDNLPGSPVVVAEAPQLQLLKRAELVFTHGGLNTVLEALSQGKPMIVIPTAYDQPAVAARLARLKAAEVLQPDALSTETVHGALKKLLDNPDYGRAAVQLQSCIQTARGLEHATDVIEDYLRKLPVPRNSRMTIG